MRSRAGASLRSKPRDPATGSTEPEKQNSNADQSTKQAPDASFANVEQKGNHDIGQQDAAAEGKTGGNPNVSGPEGQHGFMSEREWAAIATAIERSKNYPKTAQERGIQGVVLVRFKLRMTGDVDAVEIVKSSGHDILDSASIRTVYRAAPMPYINGWIEVPISYILR